VIEKKIKEVIKTICSKLKLNKTKRAFLLAEKHPMLKTNYLTDFYYNMGCPQKIGGSYHGSK